MKKTYINPETIVVVLGTCKMIADSPQVGISTNDADAVDAGSVDTKGITDINIWDDDDEW